MGINMLMWLTMLVLFAGILFLAAASYMAIALALAPALAALLTGIGLLVTCGLLILVVRMQLYPARTRRSAMNQSAEPSTNTREPAAGNQPVDWLRDNSDIALAGALVTGIVLIASPGLRRFAVRTIAPALGARALRALRNNQTRSS